MRRSVLLSLQKYVHFSALFAIPRQKWAYYFFQQLFVSFYIFLTIIIFVNNFSTDSFLKVELREVFIVYLFCV